MGPLGGEVSRQLRCVGEGVSVDQGKVVGVEIVEDGTLGADANGQVGLVQLGLGVGQTAGQHQLTDRQPFSIDLKAMGLAGFGVDQANKIVGAAHCGQLHVGDFIGVDRAVEAHGVGHQAGFPTGFD